MSSIQTGDANISELCLDKITASLNSLDINQPDNLLKLKQLQTSLQSVSCKVFKKIKSADDPVRKKLLDIAIPFKNGTPISAIALLQNFNFKKLIWIFEMKIIPGTPMKRGVCCI